MDTMYQHGKIQEESMYYEHKKHDGSLPLVGVNTFLRNPSTMLLPLPPLAGEGWDGGTPRAYHRPMTPRHPMSEIVFLVEEAPEGGLTARALGESIYTQADTIEALREEVRDAVRCHFGQGQGPAVIRLHYVRDEVLAA